MDHCIKVQYIIDGKYYEDNGKSPLYRLNINEDNSGDITIDIETDVELEDFHISLTIANATNQNSLFYANGYQTESPSNEYFAEDSMPKASRILTHFMNATGWSYKSPTACQKLAKTGEFYGYNLCYYRQNFSEYIHLYGSLDEVTSYTKFTADMNAGNLTFTRDFTGSKISSNCNIMNIASIKGDYNQVFDKYFQKIQALSKTAKRNDSTNNLVYYSTYSQHKSLIHEKIIMSEFNALSSRYYDCNTLMLEEGYCKFNTDWCHIDSKKIPSGIKSLVSRLHYSGKKAGIWLAPLLVHPTSRIAKEHIDWLIKKGETPLIMSPHWGGCYALDTNNEKAVEYIKKVINTIISDWGFDIVKLDSLYIAGAIPHGGKTNSQLDSELVAMLRTELKDKIMIVSGSTIPALYHTADYVDIAPHLTNIWDGLLANIASLEYPTSKHCVQTMLTRRYLKDRVFKIDTPLELRSNKRSLSLEGAASSLICTQLSNTRSIGHSLDKLSSVKLNSLDKLQRMPITGDIKINYIENDCIRIDYKGEGAKRKYILNMQDPKQSHS